jgi:hypothetical protein
MVGLYSSIFKCDRGVTGIQNEQAATLLMCLKEIEKCNIFVGCYGERYGWCLSQVLIDFRYQFCRVATEIQATKMNYWEDPLTLQSRNFHGMHSQLWKMNLTIGSMS